MTIKKKKKRSGKNRDYCPWQTSREMTNGVSVRTHTMTTSTTINQKGKHHLSLIKAQGKYSNEQHSKENEIYMATPLSHSVIPALEILQK